MPDSEDVTLGEVNRSVRRLEAAVTILSSQMTVALGPVGEMRVRVDTHEKDLNKLWDTSRETDQKIDDCIRDVKMSLGEEIRENKAKTDKIELRAATAAGAIMGVGFLVKFLFKL